MSVLKCVRAYEKLVNREKGSAKMRWETVELIENVSKTEFLHSNLRGAKDAKRILNSTATG